MKYSTMSYTFSRQPDHFDLEKMLAFTVKHMDGIDFVSLHGEEAGDLRKRCDDLAIPVVCHTFFAAGLPSLDPEERSEAVDLCKQGIEAAVELGAPAVMIPTPPVADVDRDVLRQRWIDGLKDVIGFAESAGIALTVENFPGATSPFVIADDFLEAQAEIPGLRLTYDNGNCAGGEDPAESFRKCADFAVHAHFKDWDISPVMDEANGFPANRKMMDGRYCRAALIGEGTIDHGSCLRAMQETGYEGFINIEYENNKYDPFDATLRAVEHLRSVEPA